MKYGLKLIVIVMFLGVLTIAPVYAEFVINKMALLYYMGGVELDRIIIASCLACVFSFLPHGIGYFSLKKGLKLMAFFLFLIACALFGLMTYGMMQLNMGLFGLALIAIFFSLNIIMSRFFHQKLAQYLPLIQKQFLESLCPRLLRDLAEMTKTLDAAKKEADNKAVQKVTDEIKSEKNAILDLAGKRDQIKRALDHHSDQLDELLADIKVMIDDGYSSFRPSNTKLM